MNIRQKTALECNIDVAQRELDSRDAQGEDVSLLRVCQQSAQIVEVGDEWLSQYDDHELCGEHYAGF